MSEPLRPARALAGFGAFLVAVAAFNLIEHDPTVELRAVSVPPSPLPALRGLDARRAPGEQRVFVAGASLTSGYPYQPLGDASFAAQLGGGLAALFPDRRIVSRPAAKPALDSPLLVEMVRELCEHDPSLVIVTLGSNEFANRLFGGKPLLPERVGSVVSDRLSRARALLYRLPGVAGGRSRSEGSDAFMQQQLIKRVIRDARPGKPLLGSLTVSREEQRLLFARLRRSMRRMSEIASAKRVPLVFLVAVYGLGGFAPWGVLDAPHAAEADALVRRSWRGLDSGLLAEVDALLEKAPGRADLHFLRARCLREADRTSEARAAFERARDLDQVPMHLTGEVQATIEDEARALGRRCLVLNDAVAALSPDGIPGPTSFLDYGHLDLRGHEECAVFLARELAAAELLPTLPAGWEERFRLAARALVDRSVDRESRALAPSNMAWADGNFSLVFGNFRDAFPYLREAYRRRPTEPEFALNLMFCTYALAGRLGEVSGPESRSLDAKHAEIGRRLAGAHAAGGLDAFLYGILESR